MLVIVADCSPCASSLIYLTYQAGRLRGGKGTNTTGPHPAYGSRGHHEGATGGDIRPVESPPEAGGGLFEGDIIPDYESILKGYGPEVVQELEEQGLLAKGQNKTGSTLRQADVDRRWTTRVDGVVHVPYAFSGEHDGDDVAVIESAIKELGDRSKVVKFVPRSSEGDYIIIVNGGGCSSFVGKQGGEQPVTLAVSGCVTHGIVQHEFLHALGFNHEQSRPDRDEFVRINVENIDPDAAHNFDKRTESDSLGSPYDYGSVMHYGKDDFSANGGDTITAPEAIGQREGADDEDIEQVILLYQCVSGARSLDQFLASPCNPDCPCWEGASGCNAENEACVGSLECNADNQCAQPGVVGQGGGCSVFAEDQYFDPEPGACYNLGGNWWNDRITYIRSSSNTCIQLWEDEGGGEYLEHCGDEWFELDGTLGKQVSRICCPVI